MIEIVVVLAIFIILAGIFVPVCTSVRERAKRTTCVSNLKQIATALMLYAEDFDGFYPSIVVDMYDRKCLTTQWGASENYLDRFPLLSDTLRPYLRSEGVFVCPSTLGIRDNDLDGGSCLVSTDEIRTWPMTYIQRTELSINGVNIASISNQHDIDVLHCHGVFHGNPAPTQRVMNVLFLDQHVRSLGRDLFVRVSNTRWQF